MFTRAAKAAVEIFAGAIVQSFGGRFTYASILLGFSRLADFGGRMAAWFQKINIFYNRFPLARDATTHTKSTRAPARVSSGPLQVLIAVPLRPAVRYAQR